MPATEATLTAAQDGVTHTRAYRGRVQNKPGPITCRTCGQGQETLGHILSACPVQAFKAYTVRHNRVLYLLVKAVMQSLSLTPPRELRGPGGTLKPGEYGTKRQQLRVDQLVPTMEEVRVTLQSPPGCMPVLAMTLYYSHAGQRETPRPVGGADQAEDHSHSRGCLCMGPAC